MEEWVFVYGTLRRGGSREAERFYPGAKLVAPGVVQGTLYDLGDYPGLRLEGDGMVKGEILRVTPAALAGLDEWEGIDPDAPEAGEYRRLRVSVRPDEGVISPHGLNGGEGVVTCWIYEIAAEYCAGRRVIASGDWIREINERGRGS